jgi:hypothetical protein
MATTHLSKEAREIRSKLALRFNTLFNHYEVYTTIHGSGGLFRWMAITDEVCEWYKTKFGLVVTQYLQPSQTTGGVMEISYSQKKDPNEPIQ